MVRRSPYWYDLIDFKCGCWNWLGSKKYNGYGHYFEDGQKYQAHRFIWTKFFGPIPEGLELDHLCGNYSCVRPDHLDAVDHKTNTLRNYSPPSRNARKERCINGHIFDIFRIEEGAPVRRCRTCKRVRDRMYKKKARGKDGSQTSLAQ